MACLEPDSRIPDMSLCAIGHTVNGHSYVGSSESGGANSFSPSPVAFSKSSAIWRRPASSAAVLDPMLRRWSMKRSVVYLMVLTVRPGSHARLATITSRRSCAWNSALMAASVCISMGPRYSFASSHTGLKLRFRAAMHCSVTTGLASTMPPCYTPPHPWRRPCACTGGGMERFSSASLFPSKLPDSLQQPVHELGSNLCAATGSQIRLNPHQLSDFITQQLSCFRSDFSVYYLLAHHCAVRFPGPECFRSKAFCMSAGITHILIHHSLAAPFRPISFGLSPIHGLTRVLMSGQAQGFASSSLIALKPRHHAQRVAQALAEFRRQPARADLLPDPGAIRLPGRRRVRIKACRFIIQLTHQSSIVPPAQTLAAALA